MSYCRWSSDNFACDLYCYESADGFVTHVAGNRIIGDIPKISLFPTDGEDTKAWAAKFTEEMKAQHAFLDTCEREPIGLPFDGQTFTDPTLAEFRARLIGLREAGYHFPDYVIEAVDEEIAQTVVAQQ